MQGILKADIFFFVTTVAIVIVAGLLAAALIYVIRIVRDVKHISEKVRNETDAITEDVSTLRASLKEKGFRWTPFISFFNKFQNRKRGRTTINKK